MNSWISTLDVPAADAHEEGELDGWPELDALSDPTTYTATEATSLATIVVSKTSS